MTPTANAPPAGSTLAMALLVSMSTAARQKLSLGRAAMYTDQ